LTALSWKGGLFLQRPRRRLLLGLLVGVLAQPSLAAGGPYWSDSGRFQLSFTSALEPIEINRIHSWVIHLRTADGSPVDGARIEVSGGMPAHDHGLPTRPQATASLGRGDYLVEGLRFHMNGVWEITVTVSADGERDRVVIGLTL
jgi:hypothetical protein